MDKDSQEMRLFSYKMTTDSGFAPNPFFGKMTLATCKPQIRKYKRKGDWIAGFTSKELCCDEVGEECLIFLMQVEEKILISQYYSHPDFQRKIPNLSREEFIYKSGDNIYEPEGDGFIQLKNPNHDTLKQQIHDLSGKYVLISTKFFYFGGNPLEIPESMRPEIPKGQSAHGSLTHDTERAAEFIKYITEKGVGVHSAPHQWPGNDDSWKFQ